MIETREKISVFRDPTLTYPEKRPFNPPCEYPEYPFKGIAPPDKTNRVYAAVRETLRLLELDLEHYGTPGWNPFKSIVRPGDRVVIKPNLVMDYHINDESIFSIVTHGSVVRAIADYVEIALAGRGMILFADAPQFNANFERLVDLTGLGEVVEFFKAHSTVNTALMDLRRVRSTINHGLVVEREIVDTYETESLVIDLGTASELMPLGESLNKLFGSDYDRRVTCSHHNTFTNKYCISKRIIESDVLISVPKLKTHKKTGVTLNLKNFVGINTDKNYLPHYRVGDSIEGGDEFPLEKSKLIRMKTKWLRMVIDLLLARKGRFFVKLFSSVLPLLFPLKKQGKFSSEQPQIDAFYKKFLRKSVRTGNWEGNDTTWRMVLDITRIFFYADSNGYLQDIPQRRFFSLVDGIISGEGNGPQAPTARADGILVGGGDPLAVDLLSTRLMGFDPMNIKLYTGAVAQHRYKIGNAAPPGIKTNYNKWRDGVTFSDSLCFTPPNHWNMIKPEKEKVDHSNQYEEVS